jgi:hypothetical protein
MTPGVRSEKGRIFTSSTAIPNYIQKRRLLNLSMNYIKMVYFGIDSLEIGS